MALRRKKVSRGPRSAASHESPPPPPLLFQALISALQSPLCPKAPLLKRLRALLMCFSLRTLDSSCPVNVIPQEDICKLSEILYEELRERSHQLFSALREISISQKHARTLSSSKLWNNVEDLPLLLRCCSSVLTLLSFDQNLILEKARVLLSILSKLISFTSSGNDEGTSISFKSFHRECSYSENGYTTSVAEDLVASLHFLQPSDPHRSLLSALLEVFADELLLEESLRGLFVSVDSAFSPGEQLFRCNGNHHNVEVVLELMAAHLMLLDSNEEAIENILSRIDGYQWKGIKIPELSLTAALALLVNPIGPSVPKMLQAHLVLLVSEVVDARTFSLSTGPDLTEMDLYLKAFERSVNLYKMHMCNFHGGRHAPSAEDPFPFSCLLGKIQPSFQSCIKQVTKEKLELFVAKLENSWNSYGRNMILESKTDMLSGSLAYIRNLCDVVNWSDKDEILSVLECVILKVFNREPSHSVPHKNGGVSFQDVYLLSSILKLMSNSMFQVIWLFRKNGYTSCLHTSQDLSFQRQHNFLLEVVCCFQQFGNHLPVQHFLFERMKVHKLRHEECTGTLLHFLGLLSLCFDTRFDFLVKACLSMIMVLLNLIILEEGDLVAVRSLLALERESSSHGFFSKEEIPMADNSTQKVASTFQKIQRQCLRTVPARCLRSNVQEVQGGCSNIASGPNHTESFCVEESTEETCNGEIFLKCLLEGSKKSCDYGDLVDFIELKKGKDYIGWLRNRVKYRKRKSERMAVLRWKKKKMTWRMMKGKKS